MDKSVYINNILYKKLFMDTYKSRDSHLETPTSNKRLAGIEERDSLNHFDKNLE